jgi:hypothetical protein
MRASLLVTDMQHVQKLLFLLILLLFSSSCNKLHYPQYSVTSILPRESFVKIEVNATLKTCLAETPDSCFDTTIVGHASGVIVKKLESHSFILTAGHVCVDDYRKSQNQKIVDMKLYAIDIDNEKHDIDIIRIDMSIDTCMILSRTIDKPPVKMKYKKLLEGEKVYNVAAPVGVFNKNMIPILEGRYAGIDEFGNAMYTVPAIGGSSGSPIVDSKGVLVGMIHSVHRRFPFLSYSPVTVDLYNFILYSIKNEPYDITP